ncbi:UNVERIFIED_CONTAM: hypothetical protein Sradi_3329600 [Sesamum radiatum]|uniref:Uncharacterized protein n=1 Tax=Sesamum radiatum TaxID=300843 RepID=A0AAW2R237_SESRA
MASGGYVVRHGHHKTYPVQSECEARTVDSKIGSVPCQDMIENSPIHSDGLNSKSLWPKLLID